jgi:hypothetical protein
MIEFACDTAAFSDLRLTEALGTIARLGFRYADLDVNQHLNLVKVAADPHRIAAELIADLRVYNLKLANVSLTLPHTLLSDDEVEQQTAFDQFSSLLPLFQELSPPGITISVEQIDDSSPAASEDENSEEDQQQHLATLLRRLKEIASPLNLRVRSNDPHLIDGLETLPDTGLTFDATTLIDNDSDEVLSLLSRASYLTLRTSTEGISRDEADALMQRLHDRGYDGVLSVGVTAVEAVQIPKSAVTSPPVTATRRVLMLRDALRTARDQEMGPAKKPTSTR